MVEVAPPPVDQLAGAGARRRAARFNPRTRMAAMALGGGLAVSAVFFGALLFFDRSLHLDGTPLLVARCVEVLAAGTMLVVPLAGAGAVKAARQARSLAAAGNLTDARIAAERARELAQYVLGLGLTALIVAFGCWFFGAQDGKVRQVLFNWRYVTGSLGPMLRAFWLNVRLFVVAEVCVLIWGLVVAVARGLPGRSGAPVRFLATAYTDVFRGFPAVITIYLIVFGFPLANVPLFSSLPRDTQRFWLSVMALTLVYGAYVAEVYRAGLESIHWSQMAAARSLGLSEGQALRYAIVPQAVRRIIPPLLNDFVGLQKDTALLAFVGVVEVFNFAQLRKSQVFNLTPATGAGLAFLIITIPMARFTDYLVRRDRARMHASK